MHTIGRPSRRAWRGAGLLLVAAGLLLILGCGKRADDEDLGAGGSWDLGPQGFDLGSPDLGGRDLGNGPRRDLGPDDYDLGVLHELTQLTVSGQVRLDFSSPAPRVEVTARCGEGSVRTLTDDSGAYAITSNVEGCHRLVLEYRKESYLPTYRVVQLPPPTSPVTLDLAMTTLYELQCGVSYCIVDGNPLSRMPRDPVARGWLQIQSAPGAVDYFGGEFRDTDGKLLWLTGFGYFDLRDGAGQQLSAFPPEAVCYGVGPEAVSSLVDLIPGTDLVEMNAYTLDAAAGRWTNLGPVAAVGVTSGYDEDNLPLIDFVTERMLPDLRSGVEDEGAWVCAPLMGSGWLAWGISVEPRACISLRVTNQCRYPLPNVVVDGHGRDHGYRVTTWTDRTGRACIEAAQSEPLARDYDFDTLEGETFWLNVKLSWDVSEVDFPSLELSRSAGSCAQPETCVPLTHVFDDYAIDTCPF